MLGPSLGSEVSETAVSVVDALVRVSIEVVTGDRGTHNSCHGVALSEVIQVGPHTDTTSRCATEDDISGFVEAILVEGIKHCLEDKMTGEIETPGAIIRLGHLTGVQVLTATRRGKGQQGKLNNT